MTDITELTSVQKNANIHRLSRLIAYAPNDELRQMAVEVEHYTDQLIEALEKAQGMEAYWKTQCRGITDHCEELQARIAELESRTVKLPEGDERDDLVISITEEIAHLQRCVERYRKEEMASTTQEMEQRLLVQQIALSVLNSAAGIKVEAE